MLKYFDDKFKKDSYYCSKENNTDLYPANMAGSLCHLFKNYGGDSFNGGLYRIVKPKDVKTWSERICKAFPAYEKTMVCFGYDWLGRAFATQNPRKGDHILLFEPETGDVFKIEGDIISFHNDELVRYGDATLAEGFFAEWQKETGLSLKYNECVSYKIPPFLSGKDELDNLYVEDIDISWYIIAQILNKIRG
ncbi:DUF1851 domain-containing protein [Komagataeibacter sp. AV436]|uniref:DUF1851 domain-containing protein n=1 Tax=Komagataeibacter melomenusus TaxID=2766578 RepID=A0ABX2AF57_9PROT|nr:DUF1851 domain-containing protein [Komagataeibacter melomenusus]MBV1830753.1 DUF1851 domain-containing protein [Komagataeibacter melomenusus]NPC66410.1 DUF1851 domain-containing protein [Komagataeibacter melomenusus]